MASTSEVGHPKNVASFQALITAVTSFGSAYNPSNPAIQLTALNAQYTNADNLIDNVDLAQKNYRVAVGVRKSEFEPLKAFTTQLINAYIAVNPTNQNIAIAKTTNAKMQGVKLKKVKEIAVEEGKVNTTAVSETSKDISASQQSYDQMIEHFSKIIVLVSADPLFLPNEVSLQSATLNTKLTTLKTANLNVGVTYTAVTNTRIARDTALYAKTLGLCDIAQTVKAYVKSVFGASSPQFKMVNKIPFKSRTK